MTDHIATGNNELQNSLKKIVLKQDYEFWSQYENNHIIFDYCLQTLEALFHKRDTNENRYELLSNFNDFLDYIKPFIDCKSPKFEAMVPAIVQFIYDELRVKDLDKFYQMQLLRISAQFSDFYNTIAYDKFSLLQFHTVISTNLSLLIYDISENHSEYSGAESLEFCLELLIWCIDILVERFVQFGENRNVVTIFQEHCVQIAKSAKFILLNIPTQHLLETRSNLGAIAASILWQLIADDEMICRHLLKPSSFEDFKRVAELLDDEYESEAVKRFKNSLQPILRQCEALK
ncbi:MAG: hypothetical protein MHMPM18_001579 [Marteilia pararefringens]